MREKSISSAASALVLSSTLRLRPEGSAVEASSARSTSATPAWPVRGDGIITNVSVWIISFDQRNVNFVDFKIKRAVAQIEKREDFDLRKFRDVANLVVSEIERIKFTYSQWRDIAYPVIVKPKRSQVSKGGQWRDVLYLVSRKAEYNQIFTVL